jgi:hypothetical protein
LLVIVRLSHAVIIAFQPTANGFVLNAAHQASCPVTFCDEVSGRWRNICRCTLVIGLDARHSAPERNSLSLASPAYVFELAGRFAAHADERALPNCMLMRRPALLQAAE